MSNSDKEAMAIWSVIKYECASSFINDMICNRVCSNMAPRSTFGDLPGKNEYRAK